VRNLAFDRPAVEVAQPHSLGSEHGHVAVRQEKHVACMAEDGGNVGSHEVLLVTEADHGSWTVADLRPVWDRLLEVFGPDRLMFGSDWPVCAVAGGWNRWAEAVAELAAELSTAEREAVLAGTATRFYRTEGILR